MKRSCPKTWLGLIQYIRAFTKGLSEEDRLDLSQEVILAILEAHKKDGVEAFPAFNYAKKAARLRAFERRLSFATMDSVTIEEWHAFYFPNPEAALDILASLRRTKRPPRQLEKRYDLTGQVFGDWHVDGVAGNNIHGQRKWALTCARCGEKHTAIGQHLKKGVVKHCTQNKKDRIRQIQSMGAEAARSGKRRPRKTIAR